MKFTPQEDALLMKLVEKYGACKWDTIALSMTGRKGRQCRDRYMNYLNPNVKKDEWTLEEDMLLTEKVKEHGPKWAKISKFFEGRTGPALKNRWNYKLSRLESKNSHSKPIIDLDSEEDDTKSNKNQKNNIDIVFSNLISNAKKKQKSAHGINNNTLEIRKKQEKNAKVHPLFNSQNFNVENEQDIGKYNNICKGQPNFVNDTVIEEIFGNISYEDELGLIYDCYDYFLGRVNLVSFFEI